LPANYERTAMLVALHMEDLYEQPLLHRLIPLPAQPRESIPDYGS
jgi:hypothetical protein